MSAKGKKRKLDEAIHQDADDEVTVQRELEYPQNQKWTRCLRT